MKGNWLDPKIHKPKELTQVLTKSIVDGVRYNHIAYYDNASDEWYSVETDELMYKEYIVGWINIPE